MKNLEKAFFYSIHKKKAYIILVFMYGYIQLLASIYGPTLGS